VVNLDNGRELLVRVNDRGPFVDRDQRIIDLSRAAAERLGMVRSGTARVRVRALSTEELRGGD
jgi:rare lipoprotein A